MLRKLFYPLIVVFLFLIVCISCSKQAPSGPLGVHKIDLTATPTCTPDGLYKVFLCQQGTPIPGVAVGITQQDAHITLTAQTDSTGIAGFKFHHGGKWLLNIESVKGYDNLSYIVEPLSNTIFALDYGKPTLELQLVSGNTNIPINANTLVYTIKYHTPIPRIEKVVITLPTGAQALINPNVVQHDGDQLTATLNFPKSFEAFNSSKILQFNAIGTPLGVGDVTNSLPETLTKAWSFGVTVEYHYMAVYDYADNGHDTSFYAGIRNPSYGLSYNIPFNGAIHCDIVNSGNSGSAGMNTPNNSYNCPPDWTGFGCFTVMSKIPTSGGWNYTSDNPDNNGWLTVRFSDSGSLDVIRTFQTGNGWGITCADWCCLYGGTPSSAVHSCGTIPPGGACNWGQHFEPNHIYRQKTETITITK